MYCGICIEANGEFRPSVDRCVACRQAVCGRHSELADDHLLCWRCLTKSESSVTGAYPEEWQR